MRVLLAVLAVLAIPATAALVVPATAAAAQLPSTTTPGVKVTQSAGGRIRISFNDTPDGRLAYKPFAGRRVTVRCQRLGDLPIGAGPSGAVSTRVRMGRDLSTVELRARGDVNLCTLGRVTVATNTTARRFLADLIWGELVLTVGDQVDRRGAAATIRRLHKRAVRLSRQSASPPHRRVGIYGDRRKAKAIAATSPSGRRLFVERAADVLRTNVLGTQAQLGRAEVPSSVALPTGDQPAAGTPLPDTSDPEVTATRSGDRMAIDFTGTAR